MDSIIQEKQFWLFDLKHDFEQPTDKRIQKLLYAWYGITIVLTIIYSAMWQKNNSDTKSSDSFIGFVYFSLFMFVVLEVILFVMILRTIRSTSQIDIFSPSEDDQGLSSNPHKENHNEELKGSEQDQHNHNIPQIKPDDIRERKITNQQIPEITHGNESSISNQITGIKKGINNNNRLFSQQQVYRNSNQQLNKNQTLKVLLRAVGYSGLLLFILFGHLILLVLMIIRIPKYGVHWIVIGINLFLMITGNFFTSAVGINIVVNMIIDKTFLDSCIFSSELPDLILSLFSATAYYNILLLVVSLIWGSIYTLTFTVDAISILCIVIISLIIIFLIAKSYRDSHLYINI